MSDSNGFLVRSKFEEYLKDVLAIPTSVYEGPSFGYNDSAGRSCFDGVRMNCTGRTQAKRHLPVWKKE